MKSSSCPCSTKVLYLFDSVELHRIQTYLGGKRKDRNNVEISGDYDLVKTLTDNVLESVYWLKDKGVHLVLMLP